MPTVVLLGTLDTKADEYEFVRDSLLASGVAVVVVDAGVLGTPGLVPDVPRESVAKAASADLAALQMAGNRGEAVKVMAAGAKAVVRRLYDEGRCDGALALGGTGGTSIAAAAFRELPLGVPKVIVSTVASGDTSTYLRESDLVLMPSVVDVAGVNRLSARILGNAAASLAGMVLARPVAINDDKPLLAASMFGVTTPAVDAARGRLTDLGNEVLVFHMTGTGGRTLESLAASGQLAGVLDLTTTELADELVGGIYSAGPDRLTSAGRAGIPQVVSVGALDMVNFGPMDTVPPQFVDRNLLVHNPNVTLMRTTPQECTEIGQRLASRLNGSKGPVTLFLPLRGVSAISVQGGIFHDPAADNALFEGIRNTLDQSVVDLVEVDLGINDEAFAHAAADRLNTYLQEE